MDICIDTIYMYIIYAYNIYNQSSVTTARTSMSHNTYSCSNTAIHTHYNFKFDSHIRFCELNLYFACSYYHEHSEGKPAT